MAWFGGRDDAPDETFTCPVCGHEVRAGAAACPECGADERTGWNLEEPAWLPDTAGYDTEAGDDFDYQAFLRREFGEGESGGRSRLWPPGPLFWRSLAASLALIGLLTWIIMHVGG